MLSTLLERAWLAGEDLDLPVVPGDRERDDDLLLGLAEHAVEAGVEIQQLGRMVGRSPAMREIFRAVDKIDKVTAADVKATLARVFRDANCTVATLVVPRAAESLEASA